MFPRKNNAGPIRKIEVEKTQFGRFLEVAGWVGLIFHGFLPFINSKIYRIVSPLIIMVPDSPMNMGVN